MPDNIEIKKINPDFADTLSTLLQSSDKEYSKYFIPFPFEKKSIKKILSVSVKNSYFGVFVDNVLVGFYMLRGFDEGYKIPSYGVWISEKFSGLGISKLTLQHAIAYCKINKIKKLMLKVHPENSIAKNIYEHFGFRMEGTDPKNENLIYFKSL
jgi:RimJ/RimL family protein N-acetyltransferase